MLTFSPLLLDGRCLLCMNTYSAMTCPLYLYLVSLAVFLDLHVYKRPTVRHRNSKRVLFCTNTSRRRTCPFPHLVHHDPRGIPYNRTTLSPERLPSSHDLAIRVTTMLNSPRHIPPTLQDTPLCRRSGSTERHQSPRFWGTQFGPTSIRRRITWSNVAG